MYILFVNASAAALESYPGCLLDRAGAATLEGPVIIAVDGAAPVTSISGQFDSAAKPVDIGLALVRDQTGNFDIAASRERSLRLVPELSSLSITTCSMEEATVLSLCMNASLEVFTGMRGVFQSDPEIVPEALELACLSFEEAAELSHFEKAGIDPAIVAPLARFRVPATIKSIGALPYGSCPEGTRIAEFSDSSVGPVKAVVAQDDISMISLSGTCLPGTVGIAARLFKAVGRAGVSVLLITQSSTEYSISLCIRSEDTEKALATIKTEFAVEMAARTIDPVSVVDRLAIMTLIGDGMRRTKGIAGKCFNQLARADVNIVAIAQGSSERAISAVVARDRLERGLRMVYQAFFDSTMPIDLVVVGCGNVGKALLAQVAAQSQRLEGHGVGARLVAVTNSRRMVVDRTGLDLPAWKTELAERGKPLSIEELVALGPELVNPVLVDCTASDVLPRAYPEFMLAGFHVVTPNKRGNTGPMKQYSALRRIALHHRRRYLYETTVGAGLPVIENLQNLLHAGDTLESFSGILSGSLSFLFGRLEASEKFSAVVRDAMDKGFTEPDPRDDLAGVDVARKVLILAREVGLSMELADIELQGLIPDEYMSLGKAEFVERMPELDARFEALRADAVRDGKVLRFVGSIEDGKGRVGLQAVGPEHPLFTVKGGENALAFTTRLYSPVPLLLRGYGAGAEVTAAGIFADILRTLNWIREA
jgi:bifunctional aspartokinase / homoserine dehydrogenase 1